MTGKITASKNFMPLYSNFVKKKYSFVWSIKQQEVKNIVNVNRIFENFFMPKAAFLVVDILLTPNI